VDLTLIEKLRDATAEIEKRRDAVLEELEAAIVEAVTHDERVVDVAGAAGMSRRKVYGVLHRHDVPIDSERGRILVRHRYEKDRPRYGEQSTGQVDRYLAERAAASGELPDRDLFDAPADGPAEREMNVLEFLDLVHAHRSTQRD